MRKLLLLMGGAGWTAAVAGGCAGPAVERVTIPTPGNRDVYRSEYERPKPMPAQSTEVGLDVAEPSFYDEPLVSQRTPEQSQFETAYRGVGRPRITVFVNRTLEGEIVPPSRGANVEVEKRTEDHVHEYNGPVSRTETTKTDLKSSEYDEAWSKSIDYHAVETILTDFLACQGAVEIVSPTMVRQRLSDEQLRDLQSGRPRVLRDLAQQLETDVLIQVSAHPTKQTPNGLEIRLVGEAMNIKGGQQIGRAVVDMEPPMEKTALNRYTRYVARKLMADMTQAWTSAEPARRGGAARGGEPAAPPVDRKP